MNFRIEKDTMGEIEVPSDKLWGAQTQRSLNNFCIGPSGSMPIEVIYAFGYLKKAAAFANRDLGILSSEKADMIARVCNEIIAGDLDEHFPLVVWQTGSGTHSNMNVNEVIANRVHIFQGNQLGYGVRELHPNDDVNKSQSSNDTFPTAMHIAAVMCLKEKTLPALYVLERALFNKEKQFAEVIKIGRTHLMDAIPLTVGQEFSGFRTLVIKGIEAVEASLAGLQELAIGGTAVGTGLNIPQGYEKKAVGYISRFTGISFMAAANKFEALSANNGLVAAHGALRQIAVSLHKIANDIRMLASGPRCGIGELILPVNEPGSSIMPGKVNPSQAEALAMVCAQVIGNDVAVGFGAAGGQFQLNVYRPLIISNFIQSAHLLGDCVQSFHDNCVVGIDVHRENIQKYLDRSLMLVTALSPHVGYEKAAEIAKAAFRNGTTIKEEALKCTDVAPSKLDAWLDPRAMI